MKKIYHLGSCSTCQRILKELQPLEGVELQDIKTEPISAAQLKEMAALSGSHESLFSRRAMLFRQRGLHQKELGEEDYKNLKIGRASCRERVEVTVGDGTMK